jgi:antibiotic biosynthesis monooxygenase (ABM) superfamily enzyme
LSKVTTSTLQGLNAPQPAQPVVVFAIQSNNKNMDSTATTTGADQTAFRSDTLSSYDDGRGEVRSTTTKTKAPSITTASSSALDNTDEINQSIIFVDYRQPPTIQIQPPAKYKLWILVFALVYFAIWVSELAHFVDFLSFHGWVSPDGAQFLSLYLIVFVLVYAALDLFVATFTFPWGCTYGDGDGDNKSENTQQQYGLGPWLIASRAEWIHNTRFSDSFLMECLKFGINILEDGFSMFNTSPCPGHAATSSSSRGRPNQPITLTTNGQQDPNRSNHDLDRRSTTGPPKVNNDDGDSDDDNDDGSNHDTVPTTYTNQQYHMDDAEVVFTSPSDTCQTILKIQHHLNPDRMQDYCRWQKRVQRAVHLFPGFVSTKMLDVVSEELYLGDQHDDVEMGTTTNTTTTTGTIRRSSQPPVPSTKDDFNHNHKKQSTIGSIATHGTNHTVRSNLHTIYVTFDNIDSLNDWMLSPRRRALMKQLEPMLAVPSQALIQAKRANRRDAFTALTTQQGATTPVLPPKKWKVWWLTTVALNLTIRWVGTFLPYYMEFWSLDEKHPRLQSFVSTIIVTFLNSYVCTPFLLFLFAPWLVRRSNDVDERPVWKLLDDGIASIWWKAVLTTTFYGGCIMTWIIQR